MSINLATHLGDALEYVPYTPDSIVEVRPRNPEHARELAAHLHDGYLFSICYDQYPMGIPKKLAESIRELVTIEHADQDSAIRRSNTIRGQLAEFRERITSYTKNFPEFSVLIEFSVFENYYGGREILSVLPRGDLALKTNIVSAPTVSFNLSSDKLKWFEENMLPHVVEFMKSPLGPRS